MNDGVRNDFRRRRHPPSVPEGEEEKPQRGPEKEARRPRPGAKGGNHHAEAPVGRRLLQAEKHATNQCGPPPSVAMGERRTPAPGDQPDARVEERLVPDCAPGSDGVQSIGESRICPLASEACMP